MTWHVSILARVIKILKTVLLPRPRFSPKAEDYNVIIAGAGASGLCAAYHLQERGLHNFQVFEKSDAVAGVWSATKYPNVGCDIPSHLYSFSFYRNPLWSRMESPAQEIYNYCHRFAEKYNLYKKIKFGHKVVRARWISAEKKWEVAVESKGVQSKLKANFLIGATGVYMHKMQPKFKNEESFKGLRMHTFDWDPKVDLSGKRVACIGTGASAAQLLPKIAEITGQLYVLQRTAAFSPQIGNIPFADGVKAMFKSCPIVMRAFRYWIYWTCETVYWLGMCLWPVNIIQWLATIDMRWRLRGTGLEKKLIPPYEFGCKRTVLSDTFLGIFQKPNVKLITETIDSFDETGIRYISSKSPKSTVIDKIEVDTIIYATGYDLYRSITDAFQIYRDDTDTSLVDYWGEQPRAVLGVSVPEYPNLFRLYGPNTSSGHNSIIFMIECNTEYIMDAIGKVIEREAATIDLKSGVLESYQKKLAHWLENTTLSGRSCTSYYQSKKGFNWVVWPCSATRFWWHNLLCDVENYTIK